MYFLENYGANPLISLRLVQGKGYDNNAVQPVPPLAVGYTPVRNYLCGYGIRQGFLSSIVGAVYRIIELVKEWLFKTSTRLDALTAIRKTFVHNNEQPANPDQEAIRVLAGLLNSYNEHRKGHSKIQVS